MRNILETPPAPSRADRRVILRSRRIGRTYDLYLALVHHHLDTHGYPWKLAMRAPGYLIRTAVARAVALWCAAPACTGDCNQGRRPCNCGGEQ